MPLCQLCCQLDFATIAQRGLKAHLRLQTGRAWSYYTPRDDALQEPNTILHPFHKSLRALQDSATSCDLCRLIQNSADKILQASNDGNDPDTYELWIGGRDGAHGFQVVGAKRAPRSGRLIYDIMAGIGFCAEESLSTEPILSSAVGTYSCQSKRASLAPSSRDGESRHRRDRQSFLTRWQGG